MTFSVWPAVHLERGRLLDVPRDLDGKSTPDALNALARKFGGVYVIDVDGRKRNKADHATIQQASSGARVWVDASPRYAMDAVDLAVAGADRLTLRWTQIASDKELEEAAALGEPETLYLALELDEAGHLLERRGEPAPIAARLQVAQALGVRVLVAAPAWADNVAREVAAFSGEKWWLGPLTPQQLETLRGLGYAGAIQPATSAVVGARA